MERWKFEWYTSRTSFQESNCFHLKFQSKVHYCILMQNHCAKMFLMGCFCDGRYGLWVRWCSMYGLRLLLQFLGKTHLQSVKGVEWTQAQVQTFDNPVYYKVQNICKRSDNNKILNLDRFLLFRLAWVLNESENILRADDICDDTINRIIHYKRDCSFISSNIPLPSGGNVSRFYRRARKQ